MTETQDVLPTFHGQGPFTADSNNTYPDAAALYFIFDDSDVWYVGQTKCLHRRIISHQHGRALMEAETDGDLRIGWVLTDDITDGWGLNLDDRASRQRIECFYISQLSPRLNKQYNRETL